MGFEILDIGSGALDSGNIHLKGPNILHCDIDSNAYRVDVVCDIFALPFREKAFKKVYASHILEHVKDPLKALHELKRFADLVVIKVPNGSYYLNLESPNHLFSWNLITLRNIMSKVFDEVEVYPSNRLTRLKGGRVRVWLRKLYLLFEARFLKHKGYREITARGLVRH